MTNFVKAIQSRNYKDLNADVEIGVLSASLCHLANISYRVGKELDLGRCKPLVRERRSGQPSADTPVPAPVCSTGSGLSAWASTGPHRFRYSVFGC